MMILSFCGPNGRGASAVWRAATLGVLLLLGALAVLYYGDMSCCDAASAAAGLTKQRLPPAVSAVAVAGAGAGAAAAIRRGPADKTRGKGRAAACRGLEVSVPLARRLEAIKEFPPGSAECVPCADICRGTTAAEASPAADIVGGSPAGPDGAADSCALIHAAEEGGAGPNAEDRNFYQCSSCGLTYNKRVSTNEEENPDTAKYLSQVNLAGFGFLARWLESGLDCLEPAWRDEPSPLLIEVGSALGFFLSTARARGWSVEGYEMWPQWSEFARTHLLVPTVDDFYKRGPPAENNSSSPWAAQGGDVANSDGGGGAPRAATAVVFLHVMEHISEPVKMLKAARQALRPGGVLYCVVPLWDNSMFATEGYASILLSNFLHLNHFSPESLASVMTAAGFSEIVWSVEGPLPEYKDAELHMWARA